VPPAGIAGIVIGFFDFRKNACGYGLSVCTRVPVGSPDS
jgi:hypothetical protein